MGPTLPPPQKRFCFWKPMFWHPTYGRMVFLEAPMGNKFWDLYVWKWQVMGTGKFKQFGLIPVAFGGPEFGEISMKHPGKLI